MKKLENYFKDRKGLTLLAVFPHPDDESFVASGLFQLAERLDIKTKLICLTKGDSGENKIRSAELETAAKNIGIDEVLQWHFKEGELADSKTVWSEKLKGEIISLKPFAVLTFDPNGITGHPDHIVSSIEILNIVKNIKNNKPQLLWRISDEQEKRYFYKDMGFVVDKKPSFEYSLRLRESFKKLRSILSYKSQFKNLIFRLRIIEWYLFDHKELYYLVEAGKEKFNLLFS